MSTPEKRRYRSLYFFLLAALLAVCIISALVRITGSDHVDRHPDDSLAYNPGQGTAAPRTTNSEARTYVYECGESYTFVARIEGDTAWLFLPGETVSLKHVQSASGEKYTDSESIFLMKGDEALLEVGGKTYRDCKNNPMAAVWEHAKLNGADFRAVGNEPGWHLEIRKGVTIDFVTDYGEARYSFRTPEPVTDNELKRTTYSINENGHEMTVVLELKPHQDTMADVTYATSVTVILDGRTYHGGGRALH